MLILSLLSGFISQTPQTICLQPYNGFSKAETEVVRSELVVHFSEIMDRPFEIEILDGKTLPERFRNVRGTGFRADSILNYEKTFCPRKAIMIGLLKEDITYTSKTDDECGIYGLSYTYGNVTVVSTFRPNRNEELWKVILHEFIHTYYHLSHCEKDDPHCIMQEGHGLPRLYEKEGLCDDCKERIERKITLSKYGLMNHRPL